MDRILVPTQMIRETRKVSKVFVSLRTLLGLWLSAYGLVKLYGQQVQIDSFLKLYGEIGGQRKSALYIPVAGVHIDAGPKD